MNVSSYEIMANFYEKIYNFQIAHVKTNDEKVFLDNVLSYVKDFNSFLDVGCGTGIYTEKLHKHFKKSVGVDPCGEMLKHTNINEKIEYKNLYLKDYEEKGFDLITCFTQVANHFDSMKDFESFLLNIENKLNVNGIFCFDIFNDEYFMINNPYKSVRQLDQHTKYIVNPSEFKNTEDYYFLRLDNKLVDHEKEFNYVLDIRMWHVQKVIDFIKSTNFEIVHICKMMSFYESQVLNRFHKISFILKKVN